MSTEVKIPKKLIEVALPLDIINIAAAKEKSIRHGHPSTLHLWWARRPLAAARAVVFAQMVNDPGYERSLGRGANKEKAQAERQRLFGIMERLVKWENTTNLDVLREAREEIWSSWRETCSLNKDHVNAKEIFNPNILPALFDPFAGGGAIPLEAQRLGLVSHASDLNPVAVVINKAMIEVPSRFAGIKPIGPTDHTESPTLNIDWPNATGMAEDVRRYGAWIKSEAERHIKTFYPDITITPEIARNRNELSAMIGSRAKVIAWIWARTVKSPNPAFSHVSVPLVSTFVLSTKEGQEAYVVPTVDRDEYTFSIKMGKPPKDAVSGTKLARGANFRCLLSGVPIDPDYIKTEGQAGRLGTRLMAIVAEGSRGRVFLPPDKSHEEVAHTAKPLWAPNLDLPNDPRNFWTLAYGLKNFGDLFTQRQLLALSTFSDLIILAVEKCRRDAESNGLVKDELSLEQGGTGAKAYSEAVGLYLSLALSKLADSQNSLVTWKPSMNQAIHLFTKQSIPMVWDFAEPNVFGGGMGDFSVTLSNILRVLNNFIPAAPGFVSNVDARSQQISNQKIISTDPPYYDNISYADLSDFFYVWLARTLNNVYPNLFRDRGTQKRDELVASPYRHGNKSEAERFFMTGMKQALSNIASNAHPAFPVTIYYAFKQSETKSDAGTSSTGWETFLEAAIGAGFVISGTWPMRTEMGNRMIGSGTNALASSIILVCNKRPASAPTISRREFIRELNTTLPEALEEMTSGREHAAVAPVDLSQAIIGPGMAVFSKYTSVLEADGKPMSVRTALQLINRFMAEDDFDHDTQFCLHWFEQHSWDTGKFGEADVLARAKGTSVDGLKDGGVVESSAGTLRLLRASELPSDWRPESDSRISVWEILHHMIRALSKNGESGAGEILSKVGTRSEAVRTLAYRLYTLCERKGWAQDAGLYNSLVIAWESIDKAAQAIGFSGTQTSLFGDESVANETGKKRQRKKQ